MPTNFLDTETLETYLSALTEEQKSSVQAMRQLLATHAPNLSETIDTGKWFGGLLTYSAPSGTFAFALGPRPKGFTTFHMMAYYASKDLQERHGPALKRFLTGKSCIKFRHFTDLPEDSMVDIIANGTKLVDEYMAARK